MKVELFKSVVSKYKAVFFDAYGVLRNYKGLIPGIKETIQYLNAKDIDFYILTNDASSSPYYLASKYQMLGISEITEEKMISSGMLAKDYLIRKIKRGKVAYLGTERSAHYIESEVLHPVPVKDIDLDKASDIKALALLDDEGFDWNLDINKTINLLRRYNMPVILANTDVSYPVSGAQVATAIGGVADMIENIVGKKFMRFGKPDSRMFTFAHEHISTIKHYDRSEILMVGDTLQTDILGGNKYGIDTALVLSGNTLEENYEFNIKRTGIIPDYICLSAAIE